MSKGRNLGISENPAYLNYMASEIGMLISGVIFV